MTTPTAEEIEAKRKRLRKWIPSGSIEGPTRGINHVAVFAGDLEATAAFYNDMMGMPVVGVSANRDVPESTHMNVHLGNGMLISFFDFPHIPRLQRRAPEGVGNVMHLALPITGERYREIKGRLDENGVSYEEVGGSLYVKDPNGLGIELLPEELVVTPEQMARDA